MGSIWGHWLRLWTQSSKWRIHYDEPKCKALIDSNWTRYTGVFEVTKSESDFKIQKFKMTNPICQIEIRPTFLSFKILKFRILSESIQFKSRILDPPFILIIIHYANQKIVNFGPQYKVSLSQFWSFHFRFGLSVLKYSCIWVILTQIDLAATLTILDFFFT